MSEDLFNDNDSVEDEANTFEPDPATIAFLDQEAAAFAEIEHQFADTYGFVHKCHCDADYSSGKIVEVTECFAGMVVESLEACARLTTENKALKEMLTTMFRLNDELVESNSANVDPFAVTDPKSPEEVAEENARIEAEAAEYFHGDEGLADDGTSL